MKGPMLNRNGSVAARAATLLALALISLTVASGAAAAQNDTGYNIDYGESLYSSQCGNCHGRFGGGLSAPALDDSAPMQMYTDFDSLARYTTDTMPPASPDQMTGDDSEAVAAYLVQGLDNPVELPGATSGPAEATATGTGDPAADGGNGAPGLAAPAALAAVAAAALLRRR